MTKTKDITRYFTFGYGHLHIINGVRYDRDVAVEITAPDPRAIMHEVFGQGWSFEYERPPKEEWIPRGIRTLTPGPPTTWRVVASTAIRELDELALGAVTEVELGDKPTDTYRIVLTLATNEDGTECDAIVVYPCSTCGWERACGLNGSACHT